MMLKTIVKNLQGESRDLTWCDKRTFLPANGEIVLEGGYPHSKMKTNARALMEAELHGGRILVTLVTDLPVMQAQPVVAQPPPAEVAEEPKPEPEPEPQKEDTKDVEEMQKEEEVKDDEPQRMEQFFYKDEVTEEDGMEDSLLEGPMERFFKENKDKVKTVSLTQGEENNTPVERTRLRTQTPPPKKEALEVVEGDAEGHMQGRPFQIDKSAKPADSNEVVSGDAPVGDTIEVETPVTAPKKTRKKSAASKK